MIKYIMHLGLGIIILMHAFLHWQRTLLFFNHLWWPATRNVVEYLWALIKSSYFELQGGVSGPGRHGSRACPPDNREYIMYMHFELQPPS